MTRREAIEEALSLFARIFSILRYSLYTKGIMIASGLSRAFSEAERGHDRRGKRI